MEPISQLYCDPFEFTDQDAKIIMFGCGLIYPVTEPAVDIQWFIDQGSGRENVESAVSLLEFKQRQITEENPTHRTIISFVSIPILNIPKITPDKSWCQPLLANGTLLQPSENITFFTSSAVYSVLPHCKVGDILSSDSNRCADLIITDDKGGDISVCTQTTVIQTTVTKTTTIIMFETLQNDNTASCSLTTSNSLNVSPSIETSTSPNTDGFSIILTSSIPVVCVLLICVVLQLILNVVLCCKRSRAKCVEQNTRSMYHTEFSEVNQRNKQPLNTTNEQFSTLENDARHSRPYYINPDFIATLPKQRIGQHVTDNNTNVIHIGNDDSYENTSFPPPSVDAHIRIEDITEVYDTTEVYYDEVYNRNVTRLSTEDTSKGYAPLVKETLSGNNVYTSTLKDSNRLI